MAAFFKMNKLEYRINTSKKNKNEILSYQKIKLKGMVFVF